MGIQEFLLYRAQKRGWGEHFEKPWKKAFDEGRMEVIAEGNRKYTQNMLTLTDHSIIEIAQLVGVSEDFVSKIKKELELSHP